MSGNGSSGGGPSRRELFAAGAAAGLGGMALAAGAASAPAAAAEIALPANGRDYAKVPLAQDRITIGAVQSRVRAVATANPRKAMRANLGHMLELIDKAQFYGGKKDLLCFHEFPIQGWYPWTRAEIERIAISVPGPETAEIAKKAKQYGCYITFGAYVRDPDWPGHILSITTIVDPAGAVIAKHWKARNIKGVFPDFELFTTTIYNVLPAYIEMYGADEVVPVTRTPIGNLATSSVQREPELFRAMAMKGAELFLRTASGGFTPADVQMMSSYNGVPSVIVNNSVSPDNPGFFDDTGAGGTAIYGARGEVLAEATSAFEQVVTASLDIAAFRARHKIPDVHMALYGPVFSAYAARFAPGLFLDYQPTDLQDAKRYLAEKDRWR